MQVSKEVFELLIAWSAAIVVRGATDP
jgi:hypothetical protein